MRRSKMPAPQSGSRAETGRPTGGRDGRRTVAVECRSVGGGTAGAVLRCPPESAFPAVRAETAAILPTDHQVKGLWTTSEVWACPVTDTPLSDAPLLKSVTRTYPKNRYHTLVGIWRESATTGGNESKSPPSLDALFPRAFSQPQAAYPDNRPGTRR